MRLFYLMLLLGTGCVGAVLAASESPTPSPSPSATVPVESGPIPAPDSSSSPAAAEVSPTPAPSSSPVTFRIAPNKLREKKPKVKAKTKKAAAKPKAEPASKFLPQLLQEVEAKYAQSPTMQAEFTQVKDVVALGTKKSSSGVLMVKRPDKLRWETLKPDTNILVSDGRKFWFYTPPFDEGEHGQVIERRSSEVNSRVATALLSGRFSVAHDMKIQAEGASKFALTPKKGTAGTVERIEIEIEPTLKLIQKVTLHNRGGNRLAITLDKIELGKTMGDELFFFTPPPNTDKVSQ